MTNDRVLELLCEYQIADIFIPEFAAILNERIWPDGAKVCGMLCDAAVPVWLVAAFEARGEVRGWEAIKKFRRFLLVLSKMPGLTAELDTIARLDRAQARARIAGIWREFEMKPTSGVDRIEEHQATRKRRIDGRAPRVSDALDTREWEKVRISSQARKQREATGRWPKRTSSGRKPRLS